MNKDIILSLVFGLVVLVAPMGGHQEERGFWPVSVKANPSEKEVLPGERITVELSAFKDADGRTPKPGFLIHVAPQYGIIEGGQGKWFPTGKVFPISQGTVSFTYYIPATVSTEEDRISIFSIATTEYWDDTSIDIPSEKKIGEVKINVRRYDFARITLRQYNHYDDGNQSSTRDIEVTVGVTYKHILGPQCLVERACVLHFDGLETYKSDTEDKQSKLISSKVMANGSSVVFHMDSSGKVEAVSLPLVNVSLEWKGNCEEPPKRLNIMPVTEYDNTEAAEKMENLAEKVETEEGEMPDMEQLTKLIQAAWRLQYHPDFKVTSEWENDYYMSGEANVEKIEGHGVIKKSYIWEVTRKH